MSYMTSASDYYEDRCVQKYQQSNGYCCSNCDDHEDLHYRWKRYYKNSGSKCMCCACRERRRKELLKCVCMAEKPNCDDQISTINNFQTNRLPCSLGKKFGGMVSTMKSVAEVYWQQKCEENIYPCDCEKVTPKKRTGKATIAKEEKPPPVKFTEIKSVEVKVSEERAPEANEPPPVHKKEKEIFTKKEEEHVVEKDNNNVRRPRFKILVGLLVLLALVYFVWYYHNIFKSSCRRRYKHRR